MNKIYKIKIDVIKNINVVVSELATAGVVCGSILISPISRASIVPDTYDYQLFLDFAENKGGFKPGRSNIPLYKKGNNSGTPDYVLKYPVPDFSSASRSGISVLLHPQFLGSASHVGGGFDAIFGDTKYTKVEVNSHGKIDAEFPRLSKMVVEASPVPLQPNLVNSNEFQQLINDRKQFPLYARMGPGYQYVSFADGTSQQVGGAYNYVTGGISATPVHTSPTDEKYNNTIGFLPDRNLLYAMEVTQGDSGSPLYVWNTNTSRWEVVGSVGAGFSAFPQDFLAQTIEKYFDPTITLNGKSALWDDKNISYYSNAWTWHGINDESSNIKETKSLKISGGGDITLQKSVDLGAGGLYFDQNQNYSFYGVTPVTSWHGAGLDIGKGTTVNWYLPGVLNDNLHKIGEGTLNVMVSSPGGIKIGDGSVVLSSNEEAFENIFLTSGRGTVVIDNLNAFNPDTFHFGWRGGRLDLNGHNVTFEKVKAEDEGAVITNNSTFRSTLTLKPNDTQYIYNGHVTGFTNIINDLSVKDESTIIFNGGLDIPNGTLTQNEGTLNFQGQPVIHATSRQNVINNLKKLGDNSLLLTQQRFEQPDWENHAFNLNRIDISDSFLNLSRNATLKSDIYAVNTPVFMGGGEVWIDNLAGNALKNGNTDFKQDLIKGESVATELVDMPVYHGLIDAKQSKVIVTGTVLDGVSINADNFSPVNITNSSWSLSNNSKIDDLFLEKSDIFLSRKNIESEDNHTLSTNNLHAADSIFTLYSDGLSNDYINVADYASGGNNKLNIEFYSFNGQGTPWSGRRDQVLAIAPLETPDGYFYLNSITTPVGTYESELLTSVSGDYKQWFMSPEKATLRIDKDWTLNHSYDFSGTLRLNESLNVSLSSGDEQKWNPVTLSVDKLFTSGNNTFTLSVNGNTGESDRISVGSLAQGWGENRLVLKWMQGDNFSMGDEDIVIASAPLDTWSRYFYFPNVYTDDRAGWYVPSTRIDTSTDVKQWILNPKKSRFLLANDWTLTEDFHFPGGVEIRDTTSLPAGPALTINTSSERSKWSQHTIVSDRLKSDSVDFYVYSNISVDKEDLIRINSEVTGSGKNRLHLLFTDENGILDIPSSPDELTLANVPDTAPNDYFIASSSLTSLGEYMPALNVRTESERKSWVLDAQNSTFDVNKNWKLSDSSRFSGKLRLSQQYSVTLSDNIDNWTPHILNVGEMYASNVNFNISVDPVKSQSDRIEIDRYAEGDNNSLNLRLLLEQPNDITQKKDITLAIAPVGTSDTYFKANAVTKGLGIYKPNFEAVTDGGKKKWILKNNVPVVDEIPMTPLEPSVPTTPPDNSIPMTPLEPSIPTTPPDNSIPMTPLEPSVPTTPPDNSIPMTPLEPSIPTTPPDNSIPMTPLEPSIPTTPPDSSIPMTPLEPMIPTDTSNESNLGGYFTRTDNVSLINNLNTLMSISSISFLAETNQLNKRLGDVRQLQGEEGFWLKSGGGHAGYESMNMSWQTSQMGADKRSGNQIVGIMGTYTRGNSHGNGMSQEHVVAGGGLYWSVLQDDGLFFDVVGKYLVNTQKYNFPSEVMGTKTARGNMAIGSAQAGWHMSTLDEHFFVEPSVEFIGGHISGYEFKDENVRISVGSNNTVHSKAGLDVGVTWKNDEQHQITLTGGIFAVNNLYSSGNIKLMDKNVTNGAWATRSEQKINSDNHYLTHVSINARLSPQWRVYSELESTTGGGLHNALTGQVGVRFEF